MLINRWFIAILLFTLSGHALAFEYPTQDPLISLPHSSSPIKVDSGEINDGILRFSAKLDPSIKLIRVTSTLREGNPIPHNAFETYSFGKPDPKSTAPNGSYSVNLHTMRIYLKENGVWIDTGKYKRQSDDYIPVQNGQVTAAIELKFGQGHYDVSVFKKTNFDPATSMTYYMGIGEFTVANNKDSDPDFQWPSTVVDSDNQAIVDLKDIIIKNKTTDLEKSTAIYEWITNNIEYDIANVFSFRDVTYVASEVLAAKVGSCTGYARLNAALHRAAGIPAKVVVGLAQDGIDASAKGNVEDYSSNHAWNEVELVDPATGKKKWWIQDATWDAGGVTGMLYEFRSYHRAMLEGEKYRTASTKIAAYGRWQFTGKNIGVQTGTVITPQIVALRGNPTVMGAAEDALYIDLASGKIFQNRNDMWISTGKNVLGDLGFSSIDLIKIRAERGTPNSKLGSGGDVYVNLENGDVYAKQPEPAKFVRSPGKKYFEPDAKKFNQKEFDRTHLKTNEQIYLLTF